MNVGSGQEFFASIVSLEGHLIKNTNSFFVFAAIVTCLLAAQIFTAPATAQTDGAVILFAPQELDIGLYQRDHAPMMAEQFPELAAKVIYWSVPDLDEMSEDKAGELVFWKVSGLMEQF